MEEYPVCVASAGVLQQDGTVAVFAILLVAVTHLLLTQGQEGLRRDQVGTAQEHSGRSQQAAAGQDLQNTHVKANNVVK